MTGYSHQGTNMPQSYMPQDPSNAHYQTMDPNVYQHQQQQQQATMHTQAYSQPSMDQSQYFANMNFDVTVILPEAEYAAVPDYMSFIPPNANALPVHETVDSEMWQVFMQQSGLINMPEQGAGPAGWSSTGGDFFG